MRVRLCVCMSVCVLRHVGVCDLVLCMCRCFHVSAYLCTCAPLFNNIRCVFIPDCAVVCTPPFARECRLLREGSHVSVVSVADSTVPKGTFVRFKVAAPSRRVRGRHHKHARAHGRGVLMPMLRRRSAATQCRFSGHRRGARAARAPRVLPPVLHGAERRGDHPGHSRRR